MDKGTLIQRLEVIDSDRARVVMSDSELDIGDIKVTISSNNIIIKLCCARKMTEQPAS